MSSASLLSVAVTSLTIAAALVSGGAWLAEIRTTARHESRAAWSDLQVGLRQFPGDIKAAEAEIRGYWYRASGTVAAEARLAQHQIRSSSAIPAALQVAENKR